MTTINITISIEAFHAARAALSGCVEEVGAFLDMDPCSKPIAKEWERYDNALDEFHAIAADLEQPAKGA